MNNLLKSEDVATVEHMLESLIGAKILFTKKSWQKKKLNHQELETLNGSISIGADLLDRMKYNPEYSGVRK